MLSVSEAQTLVLQNAHTLAPEMVSLVSEALGLVLAEAVVSDVDMPPFDKAMMDGYAVRVSDLPEGQGTLTIVEEIAAGQWPQRSIAHGQTARIMTGAPLPEGADTVVMVERTQELDKTRVEIEDRSIRLKQNVLLKGRELHRGQTVLAEGAVLRAPELGLLATVGRTAARIYPRPQVAVLSTGDEIIESAEEPGPGQIRNSNGPTLVAQVSQAGGQPRYLGIARDRLESLRPLIQKGLEAPVLVLSGGVSAGRRDLVPEVLEELGVQPHFHKVEMKPGKPVFFGSRGATLVFGLPGNPVSAMVCFELFVRPAIRRLAGHTDPGPHWIQAVLGEDFAYASDRPTYHPAFLEEKQSRREIRPVPWFGSPDLRALIRANAFVLFPAGDHRHQAGQIFPVMPMNSQF